MSTLETNTLLLGTSNPLVHMALDLCKEYHAEQKDKNGRVYYEHPIRLATQCESDEEKIVALLHDVIEDTTLKAIDLENYGIPKNCVDSIIILTKGKEEPYGEYIRRVRDSNNQIAIKIKILDLKDNSNLTRINVLIDKDLKRTLKYIKSLEILLGFEQ